MQVLRNLTTNVIKFPLHAKSGSASSRARVLPASQRCWMSDNSSPSDRLHSTDIAFKPAESGWGGGSKKYETNFDRIFGSKKTTNSTEPTTTIGSPSNVSKP